MPDLLFQLQMGRGNRSEQIRQRMLSPLPASVASELVAIIRRGGEGSVEDQFHRQAEMNRNVSVPWKRTQDFGTRKAPARTLHDKGSYEAAWTGRGPGGYEQHMAHGVRVGVDRSRFPQVAVFQRSGITPIRVTDKMRGYLARAYGVHLKRSTTTLKVEGRPVSMNRGITSRARPVITRYFLHGDKAAAPAVAA